MGPERSHSEQGATVDVQDLAQQPFDPDLFTDPETGRNPQAFYKVARAAGAVVPSPFGGRTIVGRREVEFALQHPEIFSSAMEAVDLGQTVPLIPLQVDPPEHSQVPQAARPDLRPQADEPH